MPGSVFRVRRMRRLCRAIAPLTAQRQDRFRIVDLGGTAEHWLSVRDIWRPLPVSITIVNRIPQTTDNEALSFTVGDVRDLSALSSKSFDLVYSNSVIEHVGEWEDMQKMAAEVERLADRHHIQTPNFWFPVDPHYRSLMFHWMPDNVKARMLMRRGRGHHPQQPDYLAAFQDLRSVRMLDSSMMSVLFPRSTIRRERFLGMTKSLIAERGLAPSTEA